ncbi:hypothetical protein AXK11_08140 [Cephaloticoccus primus]|uniref:Lipoyl-binding domain-containing protein n=1 Tax=Cephaloticoccus primus TaxID=1548207 RepID=A0A139SJ69_9BACT|nr:biotin/lipoyl-containing protein [Cephaloticoccus primus]KXU34622.1 hypothetical protein AXK11_08140 [Cephaloticoccus primus]
MASFIIDVPVPSMGATATELNVIIIKVQAGDAVTKGQRLADLESDKSTFEFESPCDGTIHAVIGKPGATMQSGDPFVQIETSDESLRHLESKTAKAAGAGGTAAGAAGALIWTPKATRLAQEAGLDPATITDITATGPGNRVSGDDVQRYLSARRS